VAQYEFGGEEFDRAVREAGVQAFRETLDAGRPVFYVDSEGLDVVQYPDGRRCEIRWIEGAPGGHNFEIVRELKAHAA
jgi:hypothetical protein